MRAIWNDEVLAESDETIVIEKNHYFPASSLNMACFKHSDTTTNCYWKGDANYYTVMVNGEENIDAAWYYASPKDKASSIKDHVAFWHGVEITD